MHRGVARLLFSVSTKSEKLSAKEHINHYAVWSMRNDESVSYEYGVLDRSGNVKTL